jgi:trehalose 6-phosphate synthase/phosphatase
MNLIAKEYLAVKKDQPGVLVLSEFAGSAKELLEALIVNPNSKEEVALAMHMALGMPEEEQLLRNAAMRDRLRSNDIFHWVSSFIESLRRTAAASRQLAVRVLDPRIRQGLLERFRNSRERLLVLDYDGTLIPFAAKPALARPDPELLKLIARLADNPANRVVILSGRDRASLSSYLDSLPVTIAAEHGAWVRWKGESEWHATVPVTGDSWKDEIRAILGRTTERIPGSFVEEKDFSLVWHYRQADQSSAAIANAELLDTMVTFGSNLNVQILPAKKALEIRRQGISKGNFYRTHLKPIAAQFTLAAGDDWTDESLFSVLDGDVFSVRVGLAVSKARFNLKTIKDLRDLLKELADQPSRAIDGENRPAIQEAPDRPRSFVRRFAAFVRGLRKSPYRS